MKALTLLAVSAALVVPGGAAVAAEPTAAAAAAIPFLKVPAPSVAGGAVVPGMGLSPGSGPDAGLIGVYVAAISGDRVVLQLPSAAATGRPQNGVYRSGNAVRMPSGAVVLVKIIGTHTERQVEFWSEDGKSFLAAMPVGLPAAATAGQPMGRPTSLMSSPSSSSTPGASNAR